ncbi:energy transducer TonB [Geothrix rubra]|uniref:energy transducer TonB n=1 Tax=Geothrix rubra TaxID=2927977 RepID=UPI002556F9F9|nr:energy transducer TonB [Geothrix rubra]
MKTAIIVFTLLTFGCKGPVSGVHSTPKEDGPSFKFEPIHIKTWPASGPEYPAKAKAGHITGTVTVYIHVSETGQILKIYSDQGPEILRQAAEDYAKRFTFIPAKLNGRPTTARFTLHVVFDSNP